MKKLLSLILFMSAFSLMKAADNNWKLHPVFDEEVSRVVETPSYVYFNSRNIQGNSNNETYFSLFRYDKKGEELMPLTSTGILNGTAVRDLIYNPQKGYLAVLYTDNNIDFLFNDGKVQNMPHYSRSDLSYSKKVNGMAIDPDGDRLYLATDFGYVAINDKKNEVAESRIYGEPLTSFCRFGEDYIAIKGNEILKAPVSSPRLNIDEYEVVEEVESPVALFPVEDKYCVIFTRVPGAKDYIYKLVKEGNDFKLEYVNEGTFYNFEYNQRGLGISAANNMIQFMPDGKVSYLLKPEKYRGTAAASADMSELWIGKKREGLTSIKNSGEQWSITRDFMLPSSPAAFATTSFQNHADKGFLALSYGWTPATSALNSNNPMQLSAYKDGRWTNLAPTYTNPGRAPVLTSTTGMVVDPDNRNYVYVTSYHNGLARLNLNDPQDIIHISRRDDSDASNPGFAVFDKWPEKNSFYTNLSIPYFDSKGNLWMTFADRDNEAAPKATFFVWTAEDRRNSTPTDIRQPKFVEMDEYFPHSNFGMALPLKKTGNGLVVYVARQEKEMIMVADTKGTPTDTSDDKYYKFPSFNDSDGNSVDIINSYYVWEDPATGYVWVCHYNGVAYFVPSQVVQGNYQINRVKVARNDGTNLADYLLEGVAVNQITADGDGRKWFATNGAGIICTSSDGREILEEFTTENSPLPDDIVFGIGYNSADNSLMISTAKGLIEYSLPVASGGSTKADVRAYPNPVRPDFSGYVTITDIPEGSFVKITDIAGNLVKDLGTVSGFDILWDLSDSNYNRVKSGVYHIMVSPANENGKYSGVGKILVIS
ncbi:MAG: hypothetical protein J1F12_01080 [Muribaculaceae bacterium]|nr:hypothetical protein [Muribaculaceae bacterium]